MIYSFADFNVELNGSHDRLLRLCSDFVSQSDKPDISITVTESDITYEASLSEEEYSSSYLETVAAYRLIAELLPEKNAFVLHSAVFEVNGAGIAFAAHSGTGKTTHLTLWQNLLGDKLKIVNGDKPIVRFFDNEPSVPYAYGTPWNGKENLGSNMRTKLQHICFIERSEKNFVTDISNDEAIDRILNQVYMPKKNPVATIQTIQLINRLISSCKLWKIHCNMEEEAAQVAYNAIFENE